MSQRKGSLPDREFSRPFLMGPPPGIDPEDYDIGEMLRGFAEFTNECSGKTQGTVDYLSKFSELEITDANGKKLLILAREIGSFEQERGADHPWKASSGTEENAFDVTGGQFATQGSFDDGTTTPYDIEDTTVTADSAGFIVLRVERDSSTREVSTAPIIEFSSSVVPSDATTQYIKLVEIVDDGDGNLSAIQLRYQNISIFEDLVLDNGEFKLALLEIANQNIYDAPST